MRVARVFVALAVVVSSMLFAGVSSSSAQANSLSIVGHSTTAFNGLGVNVTLNLVCDPSLNIAFVNAVVGEVSGHKVAQGAASFVNNFPGVPCTGTTESIALTVFTSTGFAFKNGTGFASADVTLFDPVNFGFIDVTAGPTGVRITKK